jgi:uncharacterized membrane protein YfcA
MRLSVALTVLALMAAVLTSEPAMADSAAPMASALPWWAWVLALFVVTFILGIVAVMAGVGGGVLFVPIVSGLFPFHLDFVRGTGLLIALAGALAAGPALLRGGMANLQLAMPPALTASAAAIIGAMLGLILPDSVIQLALGTMILGVVGLMATTRKSDNPTVAKADALSSALRMHGVYHDPFTGRDVKWNVHRTPQGLALFGFIGAMGGMFGIGAGWANVPALNLVMGVPLKVSIGTSSIILSIANSAAAWVYLNHGAMLAIIAVPSILGMMLGSTIGVGLLSRTNVAVIRRVVIVLLLLAGVRALLKGFGV